MNDVFNYVGLASVFQKKECVINNEKYEYYEKNESVLGCYYTFSEGEKFVILSGKLMEKPFYLTVLNML